MRCEIVAVGTELLLGQIVDTNSSWMGERLALIGVEHHRQTKVGDNLGRIVDAISEALARADAVIVCGGLGPTQDDITREAIAQVMGVLNAVAIDADAVREITLVGPGAGGDPTASAVVADIADVARGTAGLPFGLPVARLEEAKRAPMQRHEGGYYVRLAVADRPGAAAAIATCCGAKTPHRAPGRL